MQVTRGSTVIRAIARVWSLVVDGIRWSVRNGQRIHFWTDRWLTNSTILLHEARQPVPEYLLTWTLDRFVDDVGAWRWDLFQPLLPATVLMRIAAILPPSPDLGDDIMYWGWSGDGRFTTKSAYEFLAGPQPENNGRLWKHIWSWSGPQRIRQFMWLIVKDRLLTNDERYRRHLAESASCVLCGAARETILHCLRDCCHAVQTWRRIIPLCSQASFFSLEISDWLRLNIHNTLNIQVENWSYKLKGALRPFCTRKA
ncbi:Unknown protein [Striga hermonthica]|uniref:Reverse transcriptase zinc-binding domain-containing protein n=1 Tax=Striga hermonthica TaxID=68872 RepID=A0A9N7NRQ9_STRHE|nr:Unknown protein [Striga hermonthica]